MSGEPIRHLGGLLFNGGKLGPQHPAVFDGFLRKTRYLQRRRQTNGKEWISFEVLGQGFWIRRRLRSLCMELSVTTRRTAMASIQKASLAAGTEEYWYIPAGKLSSFLRSVFRPPGKASTVPNEVRPLRQMHDWHQKDLQRPIFFLFHGPEFALALITVHFALKDGMDRFTAQVPKFP